MVGSSLVTSFLLPIISFVNELKGGNEKMTENEKKGNELDSWDGFLRSNFLGVDDIKSDTDAVVVIQVEMDTENHSQCW